MTTSYPIILAHGICPFDRLIPPFSYRDREYDDRFHYFRKIRSTLIANDFDTFHGRVSWASGLENRARDLRDEIIRITDHFTRWSRVHVIAHSMGGLDARSMIYKYRLEDRVVSLTTIGTPHLGTPYADWGLKKFGRFLVVARGLGFNLEGLKDLTKEACSRSNKAMKDFEEGNGVLYQTIAGVQPIDRVFAPLRPSFRIVLREEGENDGLVSLISAMWKEHYFLQKLDADHLNQIGWWDRGGALGATDRQTFEERIGEVYLGIARGLKD
jgi:triacylglycerol lipase